MCSLICRLQYVENVTTNFHLFLSFSLFFFCLGAIITFWLKPNQAYTSVRADLYFCRNASR